MNQEVFQKMFVGRYRNDISRDLSIVQQRFSLGYDSDEEGNLIINEEQAHTVRRIYRECLEGYGTGLIAKRLTADGAKTGKGNTIWVANSVNRILHNEKYCGDILMQKRVTLDFLTP